MRQLFQELKRRNVYRVAATYAVVVFVTLQAAELIFPATTLEGVYDVLVVIAFVGFPIALVLAWAFEMTPEGVRRTPRGEAGLAAGEPPAKKAGSPDGADPRGRRAIQALVGLGLLAGAATVGWYLVGGGGGQPDAPVGEAKVAVLPFEALGDTDSTAIAEGLHSDLLARLQRISSLTVIGRASVMRYEDTEIPVADVADTLGARWIVAGTVHSAGDQVQVQPELLNPRTGATRWSGTYRRELSADRVFAVSEEITREIARSLEAELSPGERDRVRRQPTDDLTAYQLYVRGRQELVRRQLGDMEEAVRLFRRAIERDSSFALAWAGLADAAGHRWWGFEGYDTLDVTPEEAARRALELDPDLAEAHASMGFVHYRQRRGPAALAELERAVELRPSYAEAHNWLGFVQLVLGRVEEALTHLELARDLNPEHLLARHYLYDVYIMRGEIERGLEEIRKQKRRYGFTPAAEVRALYHLGRYVEARAILEEEGSLTTDRDESSRLWGTAYMVGVETALGDTVRAQELLTEIEEAGRSPTVLAYAHAAFGDVDATLAAFEQVEAWDYVPTVTLRYLDFPEGMSRIRDDPRFDELLRSVNLRWGLNPDGSLPGGASSESETDG